MNSNPFGHSVCMYTCTYACVPIKLCVKQKALKISTHNNQALVFLQLKSNPISSWALLIKKI